MIAFTKSFKYLTPFILYVLALFAFNGTGLVCLVRVHIAYRLSSILHISNVRFIPAPAGP